jgi:hypothetical protein
MAYKKNVVGFGYLDSVLRIEARPGVTPFSRDEVARCLDAMVEAGVDAWKYSVSAKGSFPLFPSKVLPYREEYAEEGYYQWVVDQAHQRGITILSWEYMNTAPLLTAKHPEYRVKFLGWDDERKERDDYFACFLSPYGQLLKDFSVEVVNDLGFDGIWFDGSCLFGWGGMYRNRWFCCCDRCADAFGKATGLDCPQKVDWADQAFKRFVQWRYDFFENYWVELADYVRQRNPYALIVYNYFNRHYYSAMSGSPLRHRPMDALISSEDPCLNVQMQLRVNRAISDRYPAESYSGMCSGARPTPPYCEDPDPTTSVYFAKAAAAVGGWATFGADPLVSKQALTAISAAMRPAAPYIGGEPVRGCGLVFSGATKDFAHLEANKPEPNADRGPESFEIYHRRHKPAVDIVSGMGFLLNALHWPFEVVLENQFEPGKLAQYPVVILPDVQCMDIAAAAGLTAYVEAGGTLLATGETGTRDPFGQPREIGVLDDLLGIAFRSDILCPCELELLTDQIRGSDLPRRFMVSGQARLVKTAQDVVVHARATEQASFAGPRSLRNGQIFVEEHLVGAAVCERKKGKGRALFIASDIGSGYSQNPSRRSRELVRRLIGEIDLPYQTDAPANVQITAWRQGVNLVFHLLNQPSSMYRMPGTLLDYAPEDFTPTCPIGITVAGAAERVFSPTAQSELSTDQRSGKTVVTLARLNMHDVIVFANWRANG